MPELVRADSSRVSPLVPLDAAASAAFRARLQRSVRRYWAEGGATVTAQNNRVAAMESVYTRLTGGAGLEDAEWQLRRYPSSLINWPASNSKRLDVRLSREWAACCGDCDCLVVDRDVLPADEARNRARPT